MGPPPPLRSRLELQLCAAAQGLWVIAHQESDRAAEARLRTQVARLLPAVRSRESRALLLQLLALQHYRRFDYPASWRAEMDAWRLAVRFARPGTAAGVPLGRMPALAAIAGRLPAARRLFAAQLRQKKTLEGRQRVIANRSMFLGLLGDFAGAEAAVGPLAARLKRLKFIRLLCMLEQNMAGLWAERNPRRAARHLASANVPNRTVSHDDQAEIGVIALRIALAGKDGRVDAAAAAAAGAMRGCPEPDYAAQLFAALAIARWQGRLHAKLPGLAALERHWGTCGWPAPGRLARFSYRLVEKSGMINLQGWLDRFYDHHGAPYSKAAKRNLQPRPLPGLAGLLRSLKPAQRPA